MAQIQTLKMLGCSPSKFLFATFANMISRDPFHTASPRDTIIETKKRRLTIRPMMVATATT